MFGLVRRIVLSRGKINTNILYYMGLIINYLRNIRVGVFDIDYVGILICAVLWVSGRVLLV